MRRTISTKRKRGWGSMSCNAHQHILILKSFTHEIIHSQYSAQTEISALSGFNNAILDYPAFLFAVPNLKFHFQFCTL
jgi:hypothetical protein